MATSFKATKVLSVSVGKIQFKQTVGMLLDEKQVGFRAQLEGEGYTADQAEKIVDAVLKQVFGFLTGPSAKEED